MSNFMNQDVLDQSNIILNDEADAKAGRAAWHSYIPFLIAILGSFALVFARINFGGERFISDGALMMLALASYLTAAVFYLLNFYAPFRFAEQLGL